MITDLKWDIDKMDIVIENGDFVFNNSVSEQNGALILKTKNCNLDFPLIGVGISDVINSDEKTVKEYMNRWQSQCLQDGAKTASYTLSVNEDGSYNIQTNVAYE